MHMDILKVMEQHGTQVSNTDSNSQF